MDETLVRALLHCMSGPGPWAMRTFNGGTKTIMPILTAALTEGIAVLNLDMITTFNSISRAAIVTAVEGSAPRPSVRIVQWRYGEATSLQVADVTAPQGTW